MRVCVCLCVSDLYDWDSSLCVLFCAHVEKGPDKEFKVRTVFEWLSPPAPGNGLNTLSRVMSQVRFRFRSPGSAFFE